jgi:hypothetical protein
MKIKENSDACLDLASPICYGITANQDRASGSLQPYAG